MAIAQFFTTSPVAQELITSLVRNTTPRHFLEPSAGAGHLLEAIEKTVTENRGTAWELDGTIPKIPTRTAIECGDFFKNSSGKENSFDLIVSNPPYARWKQLPEEHREHAQFFKKAYGFTDNVNLYHLFVAQCIKLLAPNGELIVIAPKEWVHTSAAAPLRHTISIEGAITDFIDCGEVRLFSNAALPTLAIFRFVKGLKQGSVRFSVLKPSVEKPELSTSFKSIEFKSGNLALISFANPGTQETFILSDIFEVKVGFTTGANSVYDVTRHSQRDSFISEGTAQWRITTKGESLYLDVDSFLCYQEIPPVTQAHFDLHRETLQNRKGRPISQDNWWKYGARRNERCMLSKAPRFYVLERTRQHKIFFSQKENLLYHGGVSGIFLRAEYLRLVGTEDLQPIINHLNSPKYREILRERGFLTGDRVVLNPKSTASLEIPVSLLPVKAQEAFRAHTIP